MSGNLSPQQFKELLEKARNLSKKKEERDGIDELKQIHTQQKPDEIDLSKLGITSATLGSAEGRNTAAETINDIHAISRGLGSVSNNSQRTTGVAANVELNSKQQSFIDLAISGEDICLIGAAGTGKTTGTGKFVRRLIDDGDLPKLGTSTKWLKENVPGVLTVSFTRKAVNNIKKAVPQELQPHVLTMHKVLEFSPVFYETFDEVSQKMKKTMKFEPARTALNPLPRGIKLVIFEESSMIGVELYNMFAAALPHRPQEIFIGDIRQLPPIFGPAILGFKMSLLPVIELTEVYRQALLSPIIRLAHAVLSGDSTKFSPKGEKVKEEHPHTGKVIERIKIPSLEKFDEDGEYGIVKIQPWQKKLSEEVGLGAITQQFIAWERNGYYVPNEDIILCPFNKAFGTIELNKRIQQYLGRKRHALVHEVIAGFEKHYLAIGDRVLFDKEDAFITDIKINATYSGRPFQIAHRSMDRWGVIQEELTEQEKLAAAEDLSKASSESMDKFFEQFGGEDEERVNQASHMITIEYAYDGEVQVLASASEVNSLLGGNAITVHKMQGSEAESIFLVLHHTHNIMLQNELLYTAITRARRKLHVVCEQDSFFKGVKSHKVRGVTLQEKIDTFKGKVEFKQMQEETLLLEKQREEKRLIRAAEKREAEERVNKQKFMEAFENERNLIDYTRDLYSYQFPSIDQLHSLEPIGKLEEKKATIPDTKVMEKPSIQDRLAALKRLIRR